MKKISTILFVFCLTMAFGQKVSDYKYVSIPEKFETFKRDYDIEEYFTKSMGAKKYVVISGSKAILDLRENPCNVINADVLNDSSWLVNKVLLQFKDCNGKVIFESKGRTDIKEFVEGYQDALKQALMTVGTSNPTVNFAPQTEAAPVKETATVTIDNAQSSNISTNAAPTSNKFSNGKITLQKIQLDEKQFILAEPNSSVPYATFRSTDKKDVFRVKLANGESTLGYFENGNIIVEIPQANGDFAKEVFTGK